RLTTLETMSPRPLRKLMVWTPVYVDVGGKHHARGAQVESAAVRPSPPSWGVPHLGQTLVRPSENCGSALGRDRRESRSIAPEGAPTATAASAVEVRIDLEVAEVLLGEALRQRGRGVADGVVAVARAHVRAQVPAV